jgi:YVTN family beta-propeller protein
VWTAGGYAVTATIAVGGGPDGVALDPAVHTGYVTNINDDSVSVIDETSSAVTGTIGVGGGPFAVAMDTVAHTAYVTNGGNGTVSVIDETSGAVTGTIAVGAGPDGVAVDPAAHTVYVANGGAGTVSVIDETTGAVTATIAVGAGPDGVAVDPSLHLVYVANGGADTVSVIDETTGVVTGTITVGSSPSAVAVDPVAHTAYVANENASTVSVIDETTAAVAATVPVSSDPDGVAVDPVAHTAYVTNEAVSTVSVIGAAQPVPVTWATSSLNPSSVGQSVTFTAKVDPVDGGTLTFSEGDKTLCQAVSLEKVGGAIYHATCTTKALTAGHQTITAAYPGDARYGTSTGTLTQTVNRFPTALTVSAAVGPKWKFVLTATLTASGHPLSGQPIWFSTGKSPLCTPHTSADGVATCVLTAAEAVLAEHDHGAIRASFNANASYGPSVVTTVLR